MYTCECFVFECECNNIIPHANDEEKYLKGSQRRWLSRIAAYLKSIELITKNFQKLKRVFRAKLTNRNRLKVVM